MTPEFKTELLKRLRETPEAKFLKDPFPAMRLMIPWVRMKFPKEDLNTDNPLCSIDWNVFKRLTGVKRLDIFLNPPPFNMEVEDEENPGQVIQVSVPAYKVIYSTPCPTFSSILVGHKLNMGEMADIIEKYYIDAGTFDEVIKEMNN